MKKNEEFGEKEMNEIVSKSGEIWKVFEKLVFLHEKIVGIEQKIRRFRLSIGFFLIGIFNRFRKLTQNCTRSSKFF